ncbi:uncharacterized protein LOC113332102 [Papaver somniferum]|uniref:uncharacterized protein LOC113332102 n=1 Tax=Papaver somniferum TaxID=3469 RepID=UPI000E6F6131|nr:uncharacterized protein LOC113332102 [Papaver somniferum]
MVDSETVNKYTHFLPFDSWHVVPAVGKSGGMALGFLKNSSLEVLGSTFNMIHVVCDITPTIKNCLVTFRYGALNTLGIRNQWNYLKHFNESDNRPWLLLGDFNFILNVSEKQGGIPENSLAFDFIKNSLLMLNMHDVFSFGNPFTWCNKRFKNPSELIFEKLDRGFINDNWVSLLPQTRVTNLGRVFSDHCPILLQCFHSTNKLAIPFKYFKCWQVIHEFKHVLVNSRKKVIKGSASFIVAGKLRNLKHDLSFWNLNSFGHIKTTINRLNSEIEKLQNMADTPSIGNFILNYSKQLDFWYEIENSFYKQKSRIDYFTQYDKNTNFFNNIKLRNMYNTIHMLKDNQGNWLGNRDQVLHLLADHFKKIFASSMPRNSDIDDVLMDIKPIISDEVNSKLVAIPSVNEIFRTVKIWRLGNPPDLMAFRVGSSGIIGITFQLKLLITYTDFFRSKFLLKQLNHSFIALIPKVSNPSTLNDFRPISLTNTVYKIISKNLTNRLKPVLDSLISAYQSAFIANRKIHDNIIISHEILHSFKTRKRKNNKDGFMTIKLDLSKAFDRQDGHS